MPTGYTTVSGTKLSDAKGSLIPSATIYFQPCNNQGVPISFSPGGGGQATDLPVSAQVLNGSFTAQLADTTLSSPANICYLVTVVNPAGQQVLGPGYLIQPSGATWSLDTFVPNLGALATIQAGPAGPVGPQGPQGPANAGVGNSNLGQQPVGALDGVNSVFTLTHSPVLLWLYRNGLFQTPGAGADYVASGSTITYNTAPGATDTHYAQYTY